MKELKAIIDALPESDMELEVFSGGLSDWGDSEQRSVLGVEKIAKSPDPFKLGHSIKLKKPYYLIKVFPE